MEELIDLVATNSSPSEITDKIKHLLYARAGESIEYARPEVAASMFGDDSYDADEIDDQDNEGAE